MQDLVNYLQPAKIIAHSISDSPKPKLSLFACDQVDEIKRRASRVKTVESRVESIESRVASV